MQVSFHRLAERELNEAARYYKLHSPKLGVAFLGEVERSAQAIVQYPKAGQRVLGSVRRRLLWRFPYALLYTVRPEMIRILAVMNLKRRPMYWIGRS